MSITKNQNWQVVLQNLTQKSLSLNNLNISSGDCNSSSKPTSKTSKTSIISTIGVDVAKDKLDICLLEKATKKTHFIQISNSKLELKKFFKFLKKLNFKGKIVLEPTNIYHLEMYQIGLDLGFDIALYNPQKVKQFSKFLHHNKKTDRLDSLVLAKLAEYDQAQEVGLEEGLEKDLKDNLESNLSSNSSLDSDSSLSSSLNSDSDSKQVKKAKNINKNQLLINQLRSLSKVKQTLNSQLKHLENLTYLKKYLKFIIRIYLKIFNYLIEDFLHFYT